MNMYTPYPDLLKEFKKSLIIYHDAEDENLNNILGAAIEYVEDMIGGPPIEAGYSSRKKTLVFNRGRYDYNGDLDMFDHNFQHEIYSLSLKYRKDDTDETP